MTPDEAREQLKRVEVLRDQARAQRIEADNLDRNATEEEVEALKVLSGQWVEEHGQ